MMPVQRSRTSHRWSMSEVEGKVDPEAIYGEDFVDVTDSVTCYENGKTFQCECDQGFGVEHDRVAVKCPTCKRNVVDMDAEERGPPEREKEQTGLSQWT